ncbi:hypothetical protein G9A89_016954 [Geosiphon pyriformis]|nr:hypothetical protein G9A89_016954 [Geosiphon pyriformis]
MKTIFKLFSCALALSTFVAAKDPIKGEPVSATPKLPSAHDFLVDVHKLPNITYEGSLSSYAGLLPVANSINENDKLFFWYFVPSSPSKNLVFWFTGGNVFSSIGSMFIGHGPFSAFDSVKKTLTNNPYSWHQDAHIVYVDQPFGVGLSNLPGQSKVENESQVVTMVGEAIVNFLENFFKVFPKLNEKDLYLAGESYAGFYVPYAAKAILDQKKFQLKGISINDPTIDQYWRQTAASAIPYVKEQKLLKPQDQKNLQENFDQCSPLYGNKSSSEATGVEYFKGLGQCDISMASVATILEKSNKCFSVYDIRYNCENPAPQFFHDKKPFDYILLARQANFLAAVHASDKAPPYEACVHGILEPDNSLVTVNLIPELTKFIKVVIWNGDKDAAINHIGVEWAIGNMTWGGKSGFENSKMQPIFDTNHKQVAQSQTERNLTYVLVNDAGHFLHSDQPAVSQKILQTIILGNSGNLEKFDPHSIPSVTSIPPVPSDSTVPST